MSILVGMEAQSELPESHSEHLLVNQQGVHEVRVKEEYLVYHQNIVGWNSLRCALSILSRLGLCLLENPVEELVEIVDFCYSCSESLFASFDSLFEQASLLLHVLGLDLSFDLP